MQKYKMPISRLRMMVCLIGMLLPDVHVRTANYSTRCSERPTGETVIGASVMEKEPQMGQ